MTPRRVAPARLAATALLATALLGVGGLRAQTAFGPAAVGSYYTVEPADPAEPLIQELRVERTAPPVLAVPGPVSPIAIRAGLRTLTGQILELPDLQRLYVVGLDAGGRARLIELDLTAQQSREVPPPPGAAPALAVRALVAPDGSKLYVQWLTGIPRPETDIYDGNFLSWLGSTRDFPVADRAARFESRAPYLWTFDYDGSLLQIDTGRDRVVRAFDPRTLGNGAAEVPDAWRDFALVRLDAGHDRYRVVDVGSGEVGPPLDLDGYRHAIGRLALAARFMALAEVERAGIDRYLGRELYTATGSGTIYDLRGAGPVTDFHLVLAVNLPERGLAVESDPSVAGRLWIYGPGDRQHFDLGVPACDGKPPTGKGVRPEVRVTWRPDDPHRYAYALALSPGDTTSAWALALQIGEAADSALPPTGWGVDRLDKGWIRWTNGLGPADQNVAPGDSLAGFQVRARDRARPGFVNYRVQAATGLPRGCESDESFVKNSAAGRAIGPERIPSDARGRAKRLVEMVDAACELGRAPASACATLRDAAQSVATARDRAAPLDRMETALKGAVIPDSVVARILADATASVREALKR